MKLHENLKKLYNNVTAEVCYKSWHCG